MEIKMTQDVYVDLLFLINLSMDYICLYACTKIMRKKLVFWRLLIAAAIGGIYSVISVFLPFSVPINLVFDALFCLVICAIAFSEKGRRIRSTLLCGFLFVGISMMMGGVMTAIFNALNRLELPLDSIDGDGISTYLFAIIAAVAGFITMRSGKIIAKKSDIKECRLFLSVMGKQGEFFALSDSGNLVKDPISGKSIVLIDRKLLSDLIDIKIFDDFSSGKLNQPPKGVPPMRLIPINTAGGRSFLCAIPPDKLSTEIVTKKNKTLKLELDALIAPADIGKSAEGYGAIVPSEILKI